MPKFYTVKQVAEALDFSTNTVYKYLDEGKIKATRLGAEGRFRIPEKEVIKLLQLKGENYQLSGVLESEHLENSASQNVRPSEFSESYLQKLGILNKVAAPDLFDWFLAITAIFIGVVYFLPLAHYQLLAFEQFRDLLFWVKMTLIGAGFLLLGVDLFVPVKKHHHHIFARLPLVLAFGALTYIFYITGELWTASYFGVLTFFNLLSIFWHTQPFARFFIFNYFLVVFSGVIYAQNPSHLVILDVTEFISNYPGLFEIMLICGTTFLTFLAIFGCYRVRWMMFAGSWTISFIVLLTSINFISDQAWDRAVIAILVSSFAFIFPLQNKFEDITDFTRRDIIIAFAWIMLVIFAGTGVVFYIQNTFRQAILDESFTRVQTAVQITNSYLDDAVKTSQSFTEDQKLRELFNKYQFGKQKEGIKEEMNSLAKQLFMSSTTSRRITILDTKGNIVAAYPPDENSKKINLADRDYLQQAIKTKKISISKVSTPKVPNLPASVYIAAPILGEKSEILGVVSSALDFSKLLSKLSSIKINDNSEIIMADSERVIFLHQDLGRVGKKVEFNNSLAAAVEGRSATTEDYSERGILMLQSYAPLTKVGWGVVIQQPFSEAFRQSSYLSFTIFLVILMVGVSAILASIYIKNSHHGS